MRWFLDTEFNEDGRTIELISIALVSESPGYAWSPSYYAVSDEFDPEKCNDWVKANVLPKLPPRGGFNWRSRAQIAEDIRWLLLRGGDTPEIWGYFADYDWVVLCQLFGRMVDLPGGMPMFCRDLKQLMEDMGVKKSELPPQDGAAHDALADARWIRDAYCALSARGRP